jgi:hypothetical protein
MPIRLLTKKGKPYAYMWGWHGAKYLISRYGIRGAQHKAALQAMAAHASGYKGKGGKHGM